MRKRPRSRRASTAGTERTGAAEPITVVVCGLHHCRASSAFTRSAHHARRHQKCIVCRSFEGIHTLRAPRRVARRISCHLVCATRIRPGVLTARRQCPAKQNRQSSRHHARQTGASFSRAAPTVHSKHSAPHKSQCRGPRPTIPQISSYEIRAVRPALSPSRTARIH